MLNEIIKMTTVMARETHHVFYEDLGIPLRLQDAYVELIANWVLKYGSPENIELLSRCVNQGLQDYMAMGRQLAITKIEEEKRKKQIAGCVQRGMMRAIEKLRAYIPPEAAKEIMNSTRSRTQSVIENNEE